MHSRKWVDLTGHIYGRLTVLCLVRKEKHYSRWLCRCECGRYRTYVSTNLRRGLVRDCGCNRGALISKKMKRHGLTKTPLYVIWTGMMDRCFNPKNYSFSHYGGRGITVCERWQTLDNFISDMGPRPEGMSIDRINNDGPYSPENCRWATNKEQGRNRRDNRNVTIDGRTLTVTGWAEVMGIKYPTVRQRLRKGWSVEKALTLPAQPRRKRLPSPD